MPKYNNTQEFSYMESEVDLVLITKTTSGTLTVSLWNGEEFIDSDVISQSGTKIIYVKGQRIRFQPSGDMVYTIKAGV